MRPIRTLVPLVLMASLMIPAAAYAGHRGDRGNRGHHRGHGGHGSYERVDDGFITVRNRNAARLEVLVDGRVVGEVDGDSAARFGPFTEGRHRVRVRFNRRGLRFPLTHGPVWVSDHRPTRVDVPEADIGLVRVRNEWVEPMTVTINGRTVGRVPAGGARLLKVKNASGQLALLTPSGAMAQRQYVHLDGLERERVVLVPPSTGSVAILNPSARHALEITGPHGEFITRLGPGQRRVLNQPAGNVTLAATYRGRTVQQATVLASPFERTRWAIAMPTSSTLGVRNPNRFPVQVFVGGEYVATVAGNDNLLLHDVPVGLVEVMVRGEGRRGAISQVVTTDIDPLSGGFLPIPEARARDGRGYYGHGDHVGHGGGQADCDRESSGRGAYARDGSETADRGRGRESDRRRGRGYARN